MQNNGRIVRITVWQKLALTYIGVSLVAVLSAETLLWVGMALFLREPMAKLWLHILGMTIITACVAGGVGLWVSQPLAHRLQRVGEISQAWLRGNLSFRLSDCAGDRLIDPTAVDWGRLVQTLNLLAEHLEQDEQDLVELRERNARLTDQVRALAVVEERNRLARELHDSVKQYIFSMAMTASAIRAHLDTVERMPEALAEMVREIETSAKAAQRETTRLIEDLRPGSLQERGLVASLNDYTLLFGAQEHLLVYLDVEGVDEGCPADEDHPPDALVPPSVAEALYRVAQEALHNIARHARATRVDVQLRCTPERVTLMIHDNGVGFDPGHVRRGLGLANMQDRMLSVGGRLTLEGQVGVGTTVLAEVALPHPGRRQAYAAGLDQQRGVSDYRPRPTIENWSWLGKRLVIPVGQTWPWLPADQVHLEKPLVEVDTVPLVLKQVSVFLGLKHDYALYSAICDPEDQEPLVRIHQGSSGYEWEAHNASWALRWEQALGGRMVLTRNRQPLAAIQYQGRQMHAWTEIIYNGRGYRLTYLKSRACAYRLEDEAGAALLCVEPDDVLAITLQRALPLPLLVMVVARILDERAMATPQVETLA